jgi:hypothetical protein
MATNPVANSEGRKPERAKRRFQYTVRSLLILLLVAAVAFSIPSWRRKQYWDQWRAVQRLRELGVGVVVEPKEGKWMRSFIGDDAYVSTLGVSFERKRVTREMMDCLGTFFDLEQIVMTDCVVDNNDFAKIAHYTGVKSIYLQDTNLSDVGLKQFAGFVNVTEFFMVHSDVTTDGLKCLAGMKNLSRFGIARCNNVSEEALVQLVPLKALEHVEFGVPISDKSIPVLKKLTHVKYFNYLDVSEVSPDGIFKIKQILGDRVRLDAWN